MLIKSTINLHRRFLVGSLKFYDKLGYNILSEELVVIKQNPIHISVVWMLTSWVVITLQCSLSNHKVMLVDLWGPTLGNKTALKGITEWARMQNVARVNQSEIENKCTILMSK